MSSDNIDFGDTVSQQGEIDWGNIEIENSEKVYNLFRIMVLKNELVFLYHLYYNLE